MACRSPTTARWLQFAARYDREDHFTALPDLVPIVEEQLSGNADGVRDRPHVLVCPRNRKKVRNLQLSAALMQFDHIAIRVANKDALRPRPEADGTATK